MQHPCVDTSPFANIASGEVTKQCGGVDAASVSSIIRVSFTYFRFICLWEYCFG